MSTTLTTKRPKEKTNAVSFLPYGRQTITEDDIAVVTNVLRSDFLTQGPAIPAFEAAIQRAVHAPEIVAVSNGTAALHLTMLALGVKAGDVVLTTPNTFVADANAVRYAGGEVQFVDIDPLTGNLDIDQVAEALARDTHKKIKGVIAVHFAGQPVDLVRLRSLTQAHGAWLVDDACHALGATMTIQDKIIPIGSGQFSDATIFSFHSVKHVATGEGGAISTASSQLADQLRRLRSHGITREHFVQPEMSSEAGQSNPWYYEQTDLGYNYRLTDIQAALGTSQMGRLEQSVTRRNQIAKLYDTAIAQEFEPGQLMSLKTQPGRKHAYHLYVVQINFEEYRTTRATVMNQLREQQIGTQVHYIPIYLQPYYRQRYSSKPQDLPQAEKYYHKALSLPMYPALTNQDATRVIETLHETLTELSSRGRS